MDRQRFEDTDILTPDEVAAYLQVSRRTVDRMPLPWKYLARRRRILFRDLVGYMDRMEAA